MDSFTIDSTLDDGVIQVIRDEFVQSKEPAIVISMTDSFRQTQCTLTFDQTKDLADKLLQICQEHPYPESIQEL